MIMADSTSVIRAIKDLSKDRLLTNRQSQLPQEQNPHTWSCTKMTTKYLSRPADVLDFAEASIEASGQLYGQTPDKKLVDTKKRVKRVVGGTSAKPGQFPHQVSLRDVRNGNRHFCSASVIDHFFLLTAATCLMKFSPETIQAVTGVNRLDMSDGTQQVRGIHKAIIHENYNTTTWDNDVALLILDEPLRFDNYTKPIKIQSAQKISGWGFTENQTVSDDLQWAIVSIVDRDQCRDAYGRLSRKVNITDNMICAGGRRRDSCQGDTGGPLTCLDSISHNDTTQQRRGSICGITAFGVGCATGIPGVYTDVSKYRDWVMKQRLIYYMFLE